MGLRANLAICHALHIQTTGSEEQQLSSFLHPSQESKTLPIRCPEGHELPYITITELTQTQDADFLLTADRERLPNAALVFSCDPKDEYRAALLSTGIQDTTIQGVEQAIKKICETSCKSTCPYGKER